MSIYFCEQCKNVLTFDEDINNRTLSFKCEKCNVIKNFKSHCVFTKTYKRDRPSVLDCKLLYLDKTIPITHEKKCPKCQCQKILKITNHNLSVTYMCSNKECLTQF